MKEQWIKHTVVSSILFSVYFGVFLEQKVNLFSASDDFTKIFCFSMLAIIQALIVYYFWQNRAKFPSKDNPKNE